MNGRPITLLTTAFFNRDPRRVARALLGRLLIRKRPGGNFVGRIVETEAYLGAGDDAAHSAAGRTARNAVIWGPPGHAYVYFIYGNHYCLNVTCLPEGEAGCVLFRALEPIEGIKKMAEARGIELSSAAVRGGGRSGDSPPLPTRDLRVLKKLSSGPGRLCEAFSITRERDDGKNLVSTKSDLQLGEDGYRVGPVSVTARIGITKSADEPLRFTIAGNPFVSR